MLMPRSDAIIAVFFPAAALCPFVLLVGMNKLLVCRLMPLVNWSSLFRFKFPVFNVYFFSPLLS